MKVACNIISDGVIWRSLPVCWAVAFFQANSSTLLVLYFPGEHIHCINDLTSNFCRKCPENDVGCLGKFVLSLVSLFTSFRFPRSRRRFAVKRWKSCGHSKMFSPLVAYFGYASALNLFRAVTYFINLEGVTKIKITKQAWEDPRVQEVAYAYARTIRLLMVFRSLVCLWALCVLVDDNSRQSLCAVITIFDCYMLHGIRRTALHRDKLAIGHQNIMLPACIHGSGCVAGILALAFHWYVK